MYACHSNKSVWWRCIKGHEWKTSISQRVNGTGCPYCANKKVLSGYNDLVTTNPKLAEEWCYGRNGDLTPQMVSAGSHKRVWWKCENGHVWQSLIYSRAVGTGCPYCFSLKRSKTNTK